MYHDLREIFWWKGIKRDIAEFVAKCPNCQQVKTEHLKSSVLPQEIKIPTWKWKYINMDFVVGLPRTQKSYDFIWVVVDRLNKSARFIPIKSSYLAEDYATIFLDEIVCFHGITLFITSYRGTQFTSRFWRSFQKGLDITVKLSTTFHPKTDRQAEHTIQTLEYMLRA